MRFEQVTIIGVGLIGGSVGRAIRERGLARHVVGVGPEPTALAHAVQLGAIDAYTTELAEGVRDAEFVVVCTPVDRIADTIRAAASHVRPGTIFTDVGSTKSNVVYAVAHCLPPGVHYIPAHPIAGSERTGVDSARPDLFVGRTVVITGGVDDVNPVAEDRVRCFWEALGSRVTKMSCPGDHDRAMAAVSHLPHAVAAAVVRVVPGDWLHLCGPGFRDVTRVAAADPMLWAAIFEANRGPVLSAINAVREQLDDFQRQLEAGDRTGLVEWLAEAKRGRDALGS